jgi:hypothetical protein
MINPSFQSVKKPAKQRMFSLLLVLVILVMVNLNSIVVFALPVPKVVGAMCTPTNGSASFCAAGFVPANQSNSTTTTVTGIQVVGSWNLSNLSLIDDQSLDKDRFALQCAVGRCVRDGTFAIFGNNSFAIDLRIRSNATREDQLISGPVWSISISATGTLTFRFRVRAAGRQVDREFKIESHQAINDGQWHNVRFLRSGTSDFSFAFDGTVESNVTQDVPKENVVDIAPHDFVDSGADTFGDLIISTWVRTDELPSGTLIDSASISLGEHWTPQLFSFDTASGGNVVLGDFLVDRFGCARNSSVCPSCSFCVIQSDLGDIYDEEGTLIGTRRDMSRTVCESYGPPLFLVPRTEGSCCGQCFTDLNAPKLCAFRQTCLQELIGAHECAACALLNADIKCAREHSAECGARTEALCKLRAKSRQLPCTCDGKLQDTLPLVCTDITVTDSEASCYLQPNGSVKIVWDNSSMITGARCIGRNNNTFELDQSKQCLPQMRMGSAARKRASDYSCLPQWLAAPPGAIVVSITSTTTTGVGSASMMSISLCYPLLVIVIHLMMHKCV